MLTRWDPFAEIARLQDQMFRGVARSANDVDDGAAFAPLVDVLEEKDAFVVKAELPGVKPEDVNVTVENDVLTLRGERKLEKKDERDGYRRIERSYGTFTRSFALPKTVDAQNVDAQLADGVLTVRIPKKAAPEPRRVEVKAGGATPKPVDAQKPS